jgi:uncharacterized protein
MKITFLHLAAFLVLGISSCGQKQSVSKNKVKETAKGQDTTVIPPSLFPADPIGMVSDFEHVFTSSEIRVLDSLLNDHEKQTSNQVAVVSLQLDSSKIRSTEDFEKLSLDLAQTWGIGQKNKNNGVAIVFSVGLRKIRIEVGYGLESKLTNTEAQKILNELVLPEFKKGNYFAGILKALKAIFKEIK